MEPALNNGPSTVPTSAVRQVLAELCSLSPDQIRNEARLMEDLDLDSLRRVELLSAIQAELGVYIDEQELGCETTVAGLEQLAAQPSSPAPQVNPRRWPLTRPVRLLRQSLQTLFLFPILWLLARPKVEGRENLKGLRGPVIFAVNHNSHLDSLTALYSLPAFWRNQTAVAAAEDYFFQSRFLSTITTLLINGFPFSREGSIRPSLELCGKLLDRGWSILIYPEGTRSTNGEMGPLKSGTGLLAVELRAPVVPIKLVGLHRVLPKGRSVPRPNPVEAHIGKPLFFSDEVTYAAATRAIGEALQTL